MQTQKKMKTEVSGKRCHVLLSLETLKRRDGGVKMINIFNDDECRSGVHLLQGYFHRFNSFMGHVFYNEIGFYYTFFLFIVVVCHNMSSVMRDTFFLSLLLTGWGLKTEEHCRREDDGD